jgi:hypothetical protein
MMNSTREPGTRPRASRIRLGMVTWPFDVGVVGILNSLNVKTLVRGEP